MGKRYQKLNRGGMVEKLGSQLIAESLELSRDDADGGNHEKHETHEMDTLRPKRTWYLGQLSIRVFSCPFVVLLNRSGLKRIAQSLERSA